MGQITVDKSFLIDWQRELGKSSGRVRDLLQSHRQARFFMSVTVLGEFSAGFADLGDIHYRKIRAGLGLLPLDEETALVYRKIFRDLKARGALIGANHLWIAASAIRHQMPLVSRNVDEFRRVHGLDLIKY